MEPRGHDMTGVIEEDKRPAGRGPRGYGNGKLRAKDQGPTTTGDRPEARPAQACFVGYMSTALSYLLFTLALSAGQPQPDGALAVTVRAGGRPLAGAEVRSGAVSARTGADGRARLALPTGGHGLPLPPHHPPASPACPGPTKY